MAYGWVRWALSGFDFGAPIWLRISYILIEKWFRDSYRRILAEHCLAIEVALIATTGREDNGHVTDAWTLGF